MDVNEQSRAAAWAAENAAWNAAKAMDAAWNAARDSAIDAARDAAWNAARDAAWDAAKEAENVTGNADKRIKEAIRRAIDER